jgi:asparagine synthase (glutamine-hydrolysing)
VCGICGIAQRDPGEAVGESSLHRMASAMAHRGPDGEAVVAMGPVGLGHRRLAIVDRSPAGAQPMSSPDGSLWIVHNGEIYNHLDERRALEARGYEFRSRSDTEVILALYEEHGEACLARLRGMFAFAIWDGRKRALFLARDRAGKKPLYYQLTPRRFLFASEIKALRAVEEDSPAIDPEALHHFLSFDYVPSPRTAFRGIFKLPAGHQLVYRQGEVRVSRYFRPSDAVPGPAPDPRMAAAEIRRTLGIAVQRRLMGEVPVGVFLSGGIDSSAIVALLAAGGGPPIPTFSIAFAEASHDESHWARLIARRFGTEHHEFVVEPDLVAELPRIVRQYDEPFGDPSALPTYFLAREARGAITVALTGDGGDEGFAGYERYVKNALAARYLALPAPLRHVAAAALRRAAPDHVPFEHPLRQLARFAALDARSLEQLYCRWLLHFDAEQKQDLYTPEFRASVREDSCAVVQALFAESSGADLTARELAVDVASYLPDDLLVKTDVATMAHSMEARCPFLDQDVVALAASLPSRYKLLGTRTKWILRRALRGLLPDRILRRPKQGFGAPIDQWLRRQLRPLAHELLLSRRSIERGLFRPRAVRRLLDEHERGVREWQFHLWNLLVLELWHREAVDGERSEHRSHA